MVAKGRFDGKAIVLDEPLDLPVDSRVTVEVAEEPAPAVSALRWMVDHAVDAPGLPTDLGCQHDHYLYGKPKKV